MSKPRAFLSFTTVTSAALVAARLAVWMFPLQAPAQTPQTMNVRASGFNDGPGVAVEPGAKILHRSSVSFPEGVTTLGSVTVETTLNAKGEVTDARVISGPEELRSAVLRSVLSWHFSAEGGLPPTVQTTVRFVTAPKQHAGAAASLSAPTERAAPLYVRIIDTSMLSGDLAAKVMAALPVHVGDEFGNDQLASVRAAVKEADEHLTVSVRTSPPNVFLVIFAPFNGPSPLAKGGVLIEESAAASPAPVPKPIDEKTTASMPSRIRIGGNVQSANLIRKVTPAYPPEAKAARIQGTVRFTAVIGKDGAIISLQVVSGDPMLVQSAQEAVAQWLYKPTLLNGNPVEVITQIDVNYTLTP